MKIHPAPSRILLTVLLAAAALAQPAPTLTPEDRAAIQALVAQYAQGLGACRAEEFADLFAPSTGAFASGFRGRMVGRDRLIALVQSERQCVAPPAAGKAKAGAPVPPTAVIEPTPTGARGLVTLPTAEYQDEYVKTPQGWRFASRTVVIAAEKAAGLDAPDMLAIQRLAASKTGDYYEPDQNGVPRLMTSGVRISVTAGQVTGRAFLKDGGYDEEAYERLAPGQWRVLSSTRVPPANR